MPEGAFGEGPLEGVAGGEGTAATKTGGLDAAAASAAMDAAKTDPALAAEAAAYFRRQAELADLQIRHFEEERRLATRGADIKRFGDRLRNGLQLFVILVGSAIALGLVGMAWDASQDHGLVVEAFSVPPDLAQQGRTGQVVAKQVLDRLADMQAQTDTWRAPGSYSNNWGEALKVQIPETGVSLGELRQYLHVWLGHETHITGEIYRTAAGMVVAVRAGEDGAKRFTGQETDLDALVQQAADHVYEATQPYRYALYLRKVTKQQPEARAVLARLAQNPNPLERAWAHAGLGVQDNIEGDVPGYVREERAALREVPDFTPALSTLQDGLSQLGHDQEAADVGAAYLRALAKRNRFIAASEVGGATADIRADFDYFAGDHLAAIREDERLANSPGKYQADGLGGLPYFLALDHDAAGARSAASRLSPNAANRVLALGLAALDGGDPSAVTLFTELRAMDEGQPGGRENALRYDTPLLALAKARAGALAEASALAATTPVDCYICVQARGQVADLAGDRQAADRWFAEAIRQAPRLPQAYVERGAARLARGDVAGAIADAQQANRVGPHFADPLKLWGDALARRGDWAGARAKYNAALGYAPAWPALRRARAAVATKQ